MSFFSSLFGTKKEPDYYLKKGLKMMERGDFIHAIHEFENYDLKNTDSLPWIDAAKTKYHECRRILSEKNIELAKTHAEIEDDEQAYEHATTCLLYADDEKIKHAAEEIIKAIDKKRMDGNLLHYVQAECCDFEEPDDESYFEIVCGHYPKFILDELNKNKGLKDIVISLNRGELDKCSELLKMEKTDAVNYFSGQYLVLMGEYQKSISYYRSLVESREDELDEDIWMEILSAVKQADDGDDIVKNILDNPSDTMLTEVASYYHYRGNIEQSCYWIEEGLNIMKPSQPDLALLSLAGLVYFKKKNYEKVVEHLEMVKNISSVRGSIALDKLISLTLASAYMELKFPDNAMETILHTLKAFPDDEVREFGNNIIPHVTREDLVRQFRVL